MARVPVANPFRKEGSRSNSTTASSAKAAKKTAAKSPDDWLEDDQAAALSQGWGVFEVIDGSTHKLFFEIMLHGPRFDNDDCARLFVAERGNKGDALATKAFRIVFRSKVGGKARSKK